MRFVTPRELTCIHRVAERESKRELLVTLAYCFSFERPSTLVPATEMWRIVATDLGRDGVLDHWMPKPQAEVIVHGSCIPRSPEATSYVRLRVGSGGRKLIDKRLLVFGDRTWTLIGPSAPEPFDSMPIDYRHAFGGRGHPSNPIGRGFSENPNSAERLSLPNVEDPKHPIETRSDSPSPATFAGRDPTSGRSDGRPILNVAPTDQRVRGFFEGDEDLLIENMHPEKEVLETRLPGFRARCFVRYGNGALPRASLSEVRLNLDTIRLFPHRETAIVCFRGSIDLVTKEGAEIVAVLGAIDESPDSPRDMAHFEAVLDGCAERTGPVIVLAGKDLLPGSNETGEIEANADTSGVPDPHLDGAARAAISEIRALTERLLASGIDPELVPNLAAIGRHGIGAPEAQSLKASAREEHAARMREMAELAEAPSDSETDRGPPRFSADAEIQRLQAIVESGAASGMRLETIQRRLADPGFRASLLDVERTLHRRYRLVAHLGSAPAAAAPRAKGARAKEDRRSLVAEARRGRRDFTGADLSGEDLSGLNLEGAFFERASLRGANLSGANLKHAVLAHAALEGASLTGSSLEGANLGRVSAKNAIFRGADLRGAMLYGADLRLTDFRETDLRNANVAEVDFTCANLMGVVAERLVFQKAKLEGASFRGGRLAGCVFIECAASDLDCTGCDFSLAIFRRSVADRAIFRDAVADDIRIEESSFREADFEGATLPGASLRGVELGSARLRGANLRRSDLSGADLRGADLTDAIAIECLALGTDLSGAFLTGANLMLAIMHRAILRGADLSGTNLSCADLTATISDERTSLADSNVRRALIAGVPNE